jgi:REP element-mobilizing transposase RayT
MARKKRIHYPGALYHVMLRGNARQTVFHQDAECRFFEDILAEGLAQYAIVLHAYCWMKNHVHMALQVRDEPLSKLMQTISQRYTYWFNKRYDRAGHVFQGRYKAVLVDKDVYLKELIRYIHLNPVRAGMVTDPLDYPGSSHAAYAGKIRPPDWLSIDYGLRQFGITEPDARAAYQHFMGQTTGEELLEKLRHGSRTEGRILGNENFIQAALSRKDETVQAQIGIESLVALVANVYEVPAREMISASRARKLTQARAMATLVGVDHCGYLMSDLARHFNRDMPGMSRQVKALRSRIEKNASLQEKVAYIQDQITTITQA